MQVFRFFTIIKFRAIYFSTSLGHYWPWIDKEGLIKYSEAGGGRRQVNETFSLSSNLNYKVMSAPKPYLCSRFGHFGTNRILKSTSRIMDPDPTLARTTGPP
jgi:hypothetical protein